MKKMQKLAAKRTPWMSSSDGFEFDDEILDDEDENIDDDLDDEVGGAQRTSFSLTVPIQLFRRVMIGDARRTNHKYNLSYEREVGSDFDLNYHDPEKLEQEFLGGMYCNFCLLDCLIRKYRIRA